MATLVGGFLARAGHALTLVGTWEAALRAIPRDGVRVDGPDGEFRAVADAVPLGTELPAADVVIVLVKASATATVASAAVRTAEHGILATLQNGLGNREALASADGRRPVVVGSSAAGALLTAPGRVRSHLALTELGDDGAGGAHRLAEMLASAGLPARVVDDIDRVLWTKLAVNCAVNPLTALQRVANGALLEDPERREALGRAAREVQSVAAALGIAIPADIVGHVENSVRLTAGNRSSMLQDLERGARTEIDAICGAVVREGRRLGVPTPVNEALWKAILAREGHPERAA